MRTIIFGALGALYIAHGNALFWIVMGAALIALGVFLDTLHAAIARSEEETIRHRLSMFRQLPRRGIWP